MGLDEWGKGREGDGGGVHKQRRRERPGEWSPIEIPYVNESVGLT